MRPAQPGDDASKLARAITVLTDAPAAARHAATLTAAEARDAVAARGQFILAVSGGETPWEMLRALAREDVPWQRVHIVQVDERVAPPGHPDRNLTHICEHLLDRVPLPAGQLYAMPVDAPDLDGAAAEYADVLRGLGGSPPVLDLVHLGLGSDGHTASLVPGDPVLDITDRDVGVTGMYRGTRRMTLTFPAIDRARRVLWLVTGSEKAGVLARLRASDPAIPAGRVRGDRALVVADRAAAPDERDHE